MSSAIVGTGFMAWVHAEALDRIGIPIVGVLGSSQSKSTECAAKLRAAKAYASLDELLADDAVDCVHIVTPNRHHFEMCQRVLKAAKHVMCEKPLAMNTTESAALVQLAEAHPNLGTAVNYNVRFYPLCIEARERVTSGDVGRIFHVSGSYLQDWLLYRTDYNWRVLADEGGDLRAIADIGTHWLDLVQFVTGQHVTSVCADLATVFETRDRPVGEIATFQKADDAERESVPISTDDCGNVLLRFDNGTVGSLVVSQVTAGRKNCLRFELSGSKQSLAWNSEEANTIRIGHRDSPNEMLTRDPALMSNAAGNASNYPGGHNEGYADTFKQCFKEFYAAIASGSFEDPKYPTFQDGHREIALCEAILQSHRERKWIDVSP